MPRKTLLRLLIVLLPLMWFAVGAPARFAQKPAAKAPSVDFNKTIQPFLAENCIACHSAKKASGELNLEQFNTSAAILEQVRQIKDGSEQSLRLVDQLAQASDALRLQGERLSHQVGQFKLS